jgi:16S rRNA (guanine(966)-N(2))-methyltransferase RsmD
MRIITGTLKGRNLQVPGNAKIRPTTDRVKEGLFAVIDSRRYIDGSAVLDIFAGSGNLGFEALSRGAKQAFFVDHNQKCIEYIEKAAKQFSLETRINTMCLEVSDFLSGPPIPFDIILADPPYSNRNVEAIPKQIFDQGWLTENGILALEHSKYHHFTDHPRFLLEKKYGRTFVSFFLKQTATQTS